MKELTLKNCAFLNFAVHQEKPIDTIFKNLFDSKSMSKESLNSIKPVGTRPGTMYELFKEQKQKADGWPHLSQF